MLEKSKHDMMEIERLKEFREWILEWRNMSEEERERFLYERWQDQNFDSGDQGFGK